jgi:O-antigen ligase
MRATVLALSRGAAADWRRMPWWYALLVAGAVSVAVFLPPQVGLGLAVLLVGGVLVLQRPAWGVYALVLSVPVQQEITLGGRATLTQATMVGLLGAWWAWTAVSARRLVIPPFAVALGVYLTVMVASLTVAGDVRAGLAELARWTVVLLTYIIIANTIRTRREIIGLVACFFAGATAEALLGIWQVATRQVPPSFFAGQGGDPEDLVPRGFGTIGMPNSYAGYLNLTIALGIALSVYLLIRAVRDLRARGSGVERDRRARLARLALALGVGALTAVILDGLIASQSRGGYIGLVFGILAMALVMGPYRGRTLLALGPGAVLLVGLTVTGVLPAGLRARLESIPNQLQIYDVREVMITPENFSQVERLAHWQTAGNMFLSDPWLGIGIGNFNVAWPRFSIQGWPVSKGHAHNYYLHALAETGVAGLLAYLAVLGVALATGARAIRRLWAAGRGFETALLIGAVGVVGTIMGHSVFENLHVLNFGIHWAAVIALFYVTPRAVLPARAGGA